MGGGAWRSFRVDVVWESGCVGECRSVSLPRRVVVATKDVA